MTEKEVSRPRVLVCGGRNYRDWPRLCAVLDAIRPKPLVVIHGDAPGADQLAGLWARTNQVAVRVHPADWTELGRAAGPIRNQEMLDEEKPDLVIAFPGGHGTVDMVSRAREAGVEVRELRR